MIDPAASVFNLSASQIGRRIKAATRMAGLGEGFSAHSPRVGMVQGLSAAGAELLELMTAERWDNPAMPAGYTETQAAGGLSRGITGAICVSELNNSRLAPVRREGQNCQIGQREDPHWPGPGQGKRRVDRPKTEAHAGGRE